MFWFAATAVAGDQFHIDDVSIVEAGSTANDTGNDDTSDGDDEAGDTKLGDQNDNGQSQTFQLLQNYPNPFNPTTKIRFSLPFDGYVRLSVFNVLGELVEDLLNANKSSGFHEIIWEAGSLPAGIYVYRLDAISLDNSENYSEIKKMLLVK
jgi:hypothetical protein